MLPTNTNKRRSVTSGSGSRPYALPPEILEPAVGLATTSHGSKRVRYAVDKDVTVKKSSMTDVVVESEMSVALKLHKSMPSSALKQNDIISIVSAITGNGIYVLSREIIGFDLNNWSGLSYKNGRTTYTDFISFAVKANDEGNRWAIPLLIDFGARASVKHLQDISSKKSSDMDYIEAILNSLKSQGIAIPTDMLEKAKTDDMRAAFEQHNQSPEIVNANAAATSVITTTVDYDQEVEETEETATPTILAWPASYAAPVPLQNTTSVVKEKDSYAEKALAFLKISKELEDGLLSYLRLSIKKDIFEEALLRQLNAYSGADLQEYPAFFEKSKAVSKARGGAAKILHDLQKSMKRDPLQGEVYFWKYADLNNSVLYQVKNHTTRGEHQELISTFSNKYLISCDEIISLVETLQECLEAYYAANRAKEHAYSIEARKSAQELSNLEKNQVKQLFRQVHNATEYHKLQSNIISILARSDSSAVAGIKVSHQSEQILSGFTAPIAPSYEFYRQTTTTAARQTYYHYGQQQPQKPYYMSQYAPQNGYGHSHAPANSNAGQHQRPSRGYDPY